MIVFYAFRLMQFKSSNAVCRRLIKLSSPFEAIRVDHKIFYSVFRAPSGLPNWRLEIWLIFLVIFLNTFPKSPLQICIQIHFNGTITDGFTNLISAVIRCLHGKQNKQASVLFSISFQ